MCVFSCLFVCLFVLHVRTEVCIVIPLYYYNIPCFIILLLFVVVIVLYHNNIFVVFASFVPFLFGVLFSCQTKIHLYFYLALFWRERDRMWVRERWREAGIHLRILHMHPSICIFFSWFTYVSIYTSNVHRKCYHLAVFLFEMLSLSSVYILEFIYIWTRCADVVLYDETEMEM